MDELNADQFKFIKDMSTEEVIDEIVLAIRRELKSRTSKDLREMLVRTRVNIYKGRTLKEAGLKEEAGGFLLGTHYVEDE